MKPIDALREEHLAIGTMLDILEAALDRLDRGQPVAFEMLAGLLRFAEWYTGESHDRKEEHGLFPLAALRGAEAARTVGAFSRQHRACRRVLTRALEAFERFRGGALDAQPAFVAAGRRYAAARRRNLRSEESWLVSEALGAAAGREEAVAATFEAIERAAIGPTGREWFRQVLDDYRDIASTWRWRPTGRGTPDPSVSEFRMWRVDA